MRRLLIIMQSVVLLCGCGDTPRAVELLARAGILSDVYPDSALIVLDSLLDDSNRLSRRMEMRCRLLRLNVINKLDTVFTGVHANQAQTLVDYFDSHGTPNEQMLSHYILGRTYADQGDIPRAVDCYLDAVARSDTSLADCDYAVLGRIYSQMAKLFHQQLLLSNEVNARQQARRCFLCARDTFYAVYHQGMIAGVYIMLGKRDSAEILLRETMHQYNAHGYEQDALQASTMLMHLYADMPDRLFELKKLIDQYDQESKQFDKYHDLPTSKRLFYYYKGKYYEDCNLLDSAEFFYRKLYHPGMTYTSQIDLYSGLLSVFRKRNLSDSIAKYAVLYCMATDSSVIRQDKQQTALLAASYDYHYYKEQSLKSENKALQASIALGVTLFLLIGLIVGISYLIKHFRKIQIRLRRILTEREEVLLRIHQEEKEELERAYHHRLEQTMLEYTQKLARLQSRQDYELAVSKNKEKSRLYFSHDVVLRCVHIANDPLQNLTERAFDDLLAVTYYHFPLMQQEFEQNEALTAQMKRVCILSILNVRVSDIGRLLKVSPQRITNLRAELSLILFNKKSARMFESNLLRHFGIKKV